MRCDWSTGRSSGLKAGEPWDHKRNPPMMLLTTSILTFSSESCCLWRSWSGCGCVVCAWRWLWMCEVAADVWIEVEWKRVIVQKWFEFWIVGVVASERQTNDGGGGGGVIEEFGVVDDDILDGLGHQTSHR